MDVDDEDSRPSQSRVLICTFDPWHTVARFELRIVRLWKRLPAGDDSRIVIMSDGLPLCAVCMMLMESVAVPHGSSVVTAFRNIAEDFPAAIALTRRG